jgi:hypothetical protein
MNVVDTNTVKLSAKTNEGNTAIVLLVHDFVLLVLQMQV